jgi:hypothetical protein
MPQSPFRDDRESAAARVARLEAENAALRTHAFSALDWLGLIAAALVVAAVGLYLPLIVRPRFVAMFADFGGPLPLVTRLVVRPWFLPLVATVPAALLVVAVVRRASRPSVRRGLVVAAFALALVQGAFSVWALYAPIFALADAVRAD